MIKELNPKDTTRAMAYELWMKAPNPMVTFFKTLDVTNLIRISKRNSKTLWLYSRIKRDITCFNIYNRIMSFWGGC